MIETQVTEWTPDPGMDDAAQFGVILEQIQNKAAAGKWSGGAIKVGGKWKLIFQREQPVKNGATNQTR